MINVTNLLIESWCELLNNQVIVNTQTIPVYRTSAPIDEKGNYIVVRKESETEIPLGSRVWTKPIIITDVVTAFPNTHRDDVATEIDSKISELWSGAILNNNLPVKAGIQISNVYKQTVNYVNEFTKSGYIYRVITRYKHDILQHKN